MTDRVPHKVDVYVGQRLRFRRKLLGLTQSDVAISVGMTFQQIQKYEKGKNRLSPSVMFGICKVLNCKPSYFLDDIPVADAPIMIEAEDGVSLFLSATDSHRVIASFPSLTRRARGIVSALIEEMAK